MRCTADPDIDEGWHTQTVRSTDKQQGIWVLEAPELSFATSAVLRRSVQKKFIEIHRGDTPRRRGIGPPARVRRHRSSAIDMPGTATHKFAEGGLNRAAVGNRVISVLGPKAPEGANHAPNA